MKALTRLDENTRTTVLEAMEENEDLMFHWAVLTKTIPSIEADINTVFNHTWILFCGILLGNIQRHKKHVQKSKALRREVHESKSDK